MSGQLSKEDAYILFATEFREKRSPQVQGIGDRVIYEGF
jgi:hypothetical protein